MIEKGFSDTPFVSIVIPTFNAKKYINKTLQALESQTYPREKFEIIIIDNGSDDGSLEILESKDLLFLHNKKAKNPYISRNIGVTQARGEVIAFLDITCTPTPRWLEEGVNLLQQGADLVGGNIKFKYSSSPTVGEWYDSITFVNVEVNIRKFKRAAGGNLFIKREVWEKLGPFPENMRSGVDGFWTRKASLKGYELVFGEDVTVFYPARNLRRTIKKSYRVGKGHVQAWLKEGKYTSSILWEIFKTFSPPSIKDLRKKVELRGKPEMKNYTLQLWFISWINKITMGLGRITALLKFKVGN